MPEHFVSGVPTRLSRHKPEGQPFQRWTQLQLIEAAILPQALKPKPKPVCHTALPEA